MKAFLLLIALFSSNINASIFSVDPLIGSTTFTGQSTYEYDLFSGEFYSITFNHPTSKIDFENGIVSINLLTDANTFLVDVNNNNNNSNSQYVFDNSYGLSSANFNLSDINATSIEDIHHISYENVITAVPEPQTIYLFVLGLIAFGAFSFANRGKSGKDLRN